MTADQVLIVWLAVGVAVRAALWHVDREDEQWTGLREVTRTAWSVSPVRAVGAALATAVLFLVDLVLHAAVWPSALVYLALRVWRERNR